MFRTLSQLVIRAPGLCIGLWIGIAVLTGLLAPSKEELRRSEPTTLLPDDSPFNRAMRYYAEAFPEQTARSRLVLVFQRPSGLTVDDRSFLERLSRSLQQQGRDNPDPWRIWSAELSPELAVRLHSRDGRAAMIVVGMDLNFITMRAAAVVEQVEAFVRPTVPQGLTMEMTGSAAIGRAHNARSTVALRRTTRVTILAVLVILTLVYRSPLGAVVPLASIGLSVFIAFRVLDFLALAGWSISGVERTFTVVLLFGAGTNYALFWISRYREGLSRGQGRPRSVIEAMTFVGPTMLASAGTTIFGLMMLMSADMVIIHNSGKVLGLVLAIALLAAITLTPALTIVMGEAFFWPGSAADHFSVGQRHIWPKLARALVRRPYVVFVCGLLAVALPVLSSFRTPMRYDSFGVVPKGSTAERGLDLVKAHFSEAELFSTRVLIESVDFRSDARQARRASEELSGQLAQVPGVADVWHLGAPLGSNRGSGLSLLLASPLLEQRVARHYFARSQNVLQVEVMFQDPPFSAQAVAVYDRVLQVAHDWARGTLDSGYVLHAVGQTPYIRDVENIANGDLSRVVWLVIGVIWVIVLMVVRRPALSIFMLLATLISYAAAFGLTGWVFVDLLHRSGVDYKVRIFLFVIIVATGQDYNIFLVRRMFEELKSFDLDEAVTRSIILTGPIISSCGLIMAATLGSLASTRIDLTEQLGFACAVGILIDTFLVRPLLIPSFYLICERRPSTRPGQGKESSRRPASARAG